MSDMAIPGLSSLSASQIRVLIERLQELMSQKDPNACDFLRNRGCYGNEQREFQSIVDQILSDQIGSLRPCGNADSGNGRLQLRITA
jgi:hypothetical protein